MTNKILKLQEVMERVRLSRASIYAFIQKDEFPKPVSLGVRAVGWLEAEISEWINHRAELRGVK